MLTKNLFRLFFRIRCNDLLWSKGSGAKIKIFGDLYPWELFNQFDMSYKILKFETIWSKLPFPIKFVWDSFDKVNAKK